MEASKLASFFWGGGEKKGGGTKVFFLFKPATRKTAVAFIAVVAIAVACIARQELKKRGFVPQPHFFSSRRAVSAIAPATIAVTAIAVFAPQPTRPRRHHMTE